MSPGTAVLQLIIERVFIFALVPAILLLFGKTVVYDTIRDYHWERRYGYHFECASIGANNRLRIDRQIVLSLTEQTDSQLRERVALQHGERDWVMSPPRKLRYRHRYVKRDAPDVFTLHN